MFGDKKFTGVGYPTPVSIPDETTCLLIQVPADPAWWALMVGVIYTLTLEWNWRQFEGGITPDEASAKWAEILNQALDLASVSNSCDFDVPAPYWDDDSADDADDEGTPVDQPWYGEIVAESNTWREQVGIWAITAFIAISATPAAAIAFLPFANRFVLAFKQHNLGAIVKVLIDGVEMATVDTYAPTDGISNVTISLPAPAGLMALDVDAPVLWVMNTGTANPAVEGTPTMAVIRKRLDQTEVTPANLRWNSDCDCVQQSPDNGETWVDSPGQDPRSSIVFQVPARSTGDPQCDAAQQMHDRVKNMLDALVNASDILQAINAVVGVVSVFMFEIGIIIEAIWAVVSAIFSIGTTVLSAALTEDVYDQLLCIFYCNIGTDGTVNEAQYDAIVAQVNSDFGTVAAFAITTALSGIGWVGLTNAGALGEVTGDCAACACGTTLCVGFDDGDPYEFYENPAGSLAPIGSLDTGFGNPLPSGHSGQNISYGSFQMWVSVRVDLGAPQEVTAATYEFYFSADVGNAIYRAFYFLDNDAALIAQWDTATSQTQNQWNVYDYAGDPIADCRYVVAVLGQSSGTPITGDIWVDNICVTYSA